MKMLANFFKKLGGALVPFQNLVLISLAVWGVHILLRVLLLFRNNPYGFPFVSKPDWFIFHAVCIDFMWIANALIVFLILGTVAAGIAGRCGSKYSTVAQKTVPVLYGIFHSVILLYNIIV